ncbi:hypothetical protein GCM10017714_31460 [Curtobacterium pusillum]|uniref:DUF4129 domain-containing protein n=1 Tax=Curtobacterium pusillum TaxID=69373 RepID=A0ABX2MBT8_9MICO|nr:DUF4129 domain-containing protein [Curtobacterium pusillum]NUU13222.1 DUF4129 domain-containing protein [Curtobacterium pusillum]GLK31820.1 hypothetical protein GCM10017610_21050 [Curtobacterium pusillum]
MANDGGPHRGSIPFVPVVAFALGGLVVVAAGLGARPVLTGARWSPPVAPATAPPQPEQTVSAPATDEPQRAGARAAQHVDVTWLLVLVAVVVTVLAVLAVLYLLLNRRRRAGREQIDVAGLAVDVTADPSAEVGLQHIRRGIGRALEVLSDPRDPSDAVTAAWLGLQESAEDAGFRRGPAETPTEFTTRILRQLDVDETALGTLRRCYLAVRFGGVPATEADVASVRAALRTLEQQWAVTPTGPS